MDYRTCWLHMCTGINNYFFDSSLASANTFMGKLTDSHLIQEQPNDNNPLLAI